MARLENFFWGQSCHAPAVGRAGFQKAGTAGDLMSDDYDGVAERTGPGGFG